MKIRERGSSNAWNLTVIENAAVHAGICGWVIEVRHARSRGLTVAVPIYHRFIPPQHPSMDKHAAKSGCHFSRTVE